MKLLSIVFIALIFVSCSQKQSNYSHFDKNQNYVISTKDQKISLVLSDSTVYMKLAPSVLDKVNKDLNKEKSKNQDNDWANKFSHFVISNVQSLLNKKLEYPISEIKDVNYENGALTFTYYHTHLMTFDKIKDNDKPALANFNPSDAKEFVYRFHQLKSSQ